VNRYPQSDPNTWRTPEQWFTVPPEVGYSDQQHDTQQWNDNSRSAARLRPEIEHPPLRRDGLR
jgi:hypothetical protein